LTLVFGNPECFLRAFGIVDDNPDGYNPDHVIHKSKWVLLQRGPAAMGDTRFV